MTFRFPIVARSALLALVGTLLTAAGEFPVAPLAAVRLVATPEIAAPDATTLGDDAATVAPALAAPAARPAQLTTLVAQVVDTAPTAYGDRECLARAVYFEARGEPLEGQLAVAQVILNRVASGRYAATVCGVINQPGQFSFSRSRVPADGRDWRTAKAIAAIAATAAWDAMAPQATAFHATRVTVGWTAMHRVGTIGNHVFYR